MSPDCNPLSTSVLFPFVANRIVPCDGLLNTEALTIPDGTSAKAPNDDTPLLAKDADVNVPPPTVMVSKLPVEPLDGNEKSLQLTDAPLLVALINLSSD